MMRPTRPYRALASGVGAIVILAVVALWARGQVTGSPLETLWQVVMLALVIGAAYRVFGKQTMDNAMDAAQDLQGGGADGGDQEGDDGDA